MACRHESLLEPGKLSPPTSFTKVFKDECCLCFKDAFQEDGLFVCLTCFHGGCAEHADLHFSKTGHPLALNIRRTATVAIDRPETPNKIAKLEIRPEPEAEYEETLSIECFSCEEPVQSPSLKVISQ